MSDRSLFDRRNWSLRSVNTGGSSKSQLSVLPSLHLALSCWTVWSALRSLCLLAGTPPLSLEAALNPHSARARPRLFRRAVMRRWMRRPLPSSARSELRDCSPRRIEGVDRCARREGHADCAGAPSRSEDAWRRRRSPRCSAPASRPFNRDAAPRRIDCTHPPTRRMHPPSSPTPLR